MNIAISPSGGLATLAARIHRLQNAAPMAEAIGKVVEATASGYRIHGLSNFVRLGSLVKFHCGDRPVLAEVVRLEQETVLVRTFDNGSRISLATQASPVGNLTIRPNPSWKGRMIDALGRPIDGGAELTLGPESLSVDNAPPNAMVRKLVKAARSIKRVFGGKDQDIEWIYMGGQIYIVQSRPFVA